MWVRFGSSWYTVGMAYTTHRGKRVSHAHSVLLDAYERKTGRALYINQGARTLAEQARFWFNYLYRGGPLAARPWGGAPHIKWGRQNHALDINAPEPARSVAQFYRANGVPVVFNVPGEPWHMDTLDEAKLIRTADRLDRSLASPTIRRGSMNRTGIRRLQTLLRAVGYRSVRVNGKYDLTTRRAVRRFQKKKRLPVDGVVGDRTWAALRKVGN